MRRSAHRRAAAPPAREDTIALNSKQRAFLRVQAHSLKPVLQIGAEGASDAFVRSLEETFARRELLKIKVLESSPQGPREVAALLPDRLPDLHVAQVIGRTLVLYRPHPGEPVIRLPR